MRIIPNKSWLLLASLPATRPISWDSSANAPGQGCATLAEFELLCELAEQKGLQLMLAMATRANPAVIKVKEMIEVTKRTVLAIYA